MNATDSHQMRYFTIEQREALRAALERLIERLRREVARGPLPNHNEDTDDEAVADLETSLEVAECERATIDLKDAVRARRRLSEPAYGMCAACGIDIPYTRLLARPTAIRCIDCQRASERGTPPSARL